MLFSVTTSASLWFAWAPPKAYRRYIQSWSNALVDPRESGKSDPGHASA